jgi:hypothetical protein
MIVALCGARLGVAQVEPAGASAAADTAAAPGRELRDVPPADSLGLPGTLRGQTEYDPLKVKRILGRMGSDEVVGKTTWERKKNARTAMLCSMMLPGLGQTYNGRRLKVGVMVGFTSYYMGNMILNWKNYQASAARLDAAAPGTAEYRVESQLAPFYKEEARTYLWWSGAVWLLGLLDSWIDAHLYDVREYTPPPPPASVAPPAAGGDVSYLTVGIGFSRKHAP